MRELSRSHCGLSEAQLECSSLIVVGGSGLRIHSSNARHARTVQSTVEVESGKYGLAINEELKKRITAGSDSCKACTYSIQQYRHIKKCMADGLTSAQLEASKASMVAHDATYRTVPTDLLINQFITGVRDHVFKKSMN